MREWRIMRQDSTLFRSSEFYLVILLLVGLHTELSSSFDVSRTRAGSTGVQLSYLLCMYLVLGLRRYHNNSPLSFSILHPASLSHQRTRGPPTLTVGSRWSVDGCWLTGSGRARSLGSPQPGGSEYGVYVVMIASITFN